MKPSSCKRCLPLGKEAIPANGAEVLEVQLGTEGGVTLVQLLPYLGLEEKDDPLLFVCMHVDVGEYDQPKDWYF